MSRIDKLLKKFNKIPIPNDMTYDEIIVIAKYYGCHVRTDGGKHNLQIGYFGYRMIPIPTHGKVVKEAYIKQLKMLFEWIEENRK